MTSSSEETVSCYYGGTVLRNRRLVADELWVKGAKIIAPQAQADREINIMGAKLVPGLIDLQINGAFGIDFSSNPENISLVAASLPRYGVTAFLPTLVSGSEAQYRQAIPLLQPRKGAGAEILGIHLEGPFISLEHLGAHESSEIPPEAYLETLKRRYGQFNGVKIVTLAPELPGALESIRWLKSQGIFVAAGHTHASVEELHQGIEAGITLITHLYNAMRPFHHRDPGVIGEALCNEKLFYSLIVDDIHLHPNTVLATWKANPSGLILVSDAMDAMGLAPGEHRLGYKKVWVNEDRSARLHPSGTLAGSTVTLDDALRRFIAISGSSLSEAIEAASTKPAQLLGLKGKKGCLDIGADADFILLDDTLHVLSTYIGGESAYCEAKWK